MVLQKGNLLQKDNKKIRNIIKSDFSSNVSENWKVRLISKQTSGIVTG